MDRGSGERKRAVIVDDSRTMQALLEQMLDERLNCDIVGVARDGLSAFTMIRDLQPDLVTIDLDVTGMDVRQLIEGLEVFPSIYKIVISQSAFDNFSIKAMLESVGADACICKDEMSRDTDGVFAILSSILAAPRAGRAFTPPLAGRSLSRALSYPIPIDERERLIALATLGLANDDPDHRLDLLTEHLVKTTSFSASILTFIDQNTQWLKSAYGVERGSMARSQAICAYTICGDEPFVVRDASRDKRFARFEAVVAGPMIRSYIGCPIIGSSGVCLGALCLLDTKARRISPTELTNLAGVGKIAAHLIESFSPVPLRIAA